MKKTVLLTAFLACLCACTNYVSYEMEDMVMYAIQSRGPVIATGTCTGVSVLEVDNRCFRDLDKDGALDPYEDWRLSPEERASDLVTRLSVEELAGLMLCSHMQNVPGTNANHYGGKVFGESGARPSDLTDEQLVFLRRDGVRSVLLAATGSLRDEADWVNNVQAYAEEISYGIPVAILSDPRHHAKSDMEFEAGSGGEISVWPKSLAMAATFDPGLMESAARIMAEEYRAMGITTALSPQVDIATEPRWWRFDGTFGENAALTADMARAYCDGFQTSPRDRRIAGVWGYGSVNAMAKHWYGYGAQEGGRDGHFATGEYSVFPGDNLALHKKAYTDGVFRLKRGSGKVAAVMTGYTILDGQDPSGENVALSYSDRFIRRELREEAGFDGIVCTDWDVTFDCTDLGCWGRGKPWGVEDLSESERCFRILKVGVDQLGGVNDAGPLLEAYKMWEEEYGALSARERFERSAYRVLVSMFRTGIFENPYVRYSQASGIVGSPEHMQKGYDAQLKSVIMLKNAGQALPVARGARVYMPKRHFPETFGPWNAHTVDRWDYVVSRGLLSQYFEIADTPEDADFAIVMIDEPCLNIGYDERDVEAGGNGYVPVSLQYEDYTADSAREVSLAGGNPLESFTDRSYKGKTVSTPNRDDMLQVREVRTQMGDKPVIVAIDASKPLVVAEFEPWADAIILSFGVQRQAQLDIIAGVVEPSGLLPMQLPADMVTVETQMEDVPFDMECYRDSEGNVYDYAFGLDWKGVIRDRRVARYGRHQ